MTGRILEGDARSVLATLPAESVQCCVTSPPYWGLRDYGVVGQLGLERTPKEYVANMVEVFREVHRVLRPDGTLWLNLGDCYAGSRQGPVGSTCSRRRDNEIIPRSDRRVDGLKPKDLIGIPWMVAFALRADGWWLRQEVIWAKPNPMPEAVRDRPTRAHESVFLLTKSERYYYDAAAASEPVTGGAHARGQGVNPKAGKNETAEDRRVVGFNARWKTKQNASFSAAVSGLVERRNWRSVWTIPSKPFTGAHFATFPPALAERCILAGSRPGDLVLDPFAGAGTAGLVAARHGRDFVGIELNPRYAAMARERIAADAPLLNAPAAGPTAGTLS